ncbi:MAG: SMC-Scp complex subunit ScpB [Candidatus Paceibacterota bacterium]|jgi:segregation and condensation protein B
MNDNLEKKIEAVLFWKGEPVSIKKLSQIFEKTEEEISSALKILETNLSGRGIVLVFKEDEVTLGTSKEFSDIIDKLTKEELVRDLGKAGLETLSIIIYQGPLSRAEIDYIRGVQSNFIVRNLMIRGLIEKVPNPKDQRSFLYKPTFEMLSFMGLSKIEDMPSYSEARAEIESYKNTQMKQEEAEAVKDLESEMESTENPTPYTE